MLVDFFNQIQIVLVNTTLPANIGAAARALKTMGFNNLALVAPKTFPSGDASAVASGAADVLEHAKVFDSVEAAIKESEQVFGTSARNRSMPWPLIYPEVAAKYIHNYLANKQNQITLDLNDVASGVARPTISILFGREDRGLTNEELGLCNFHITIPSNEEYGVLNIAAAVQVICYELRTHFLNTRSAPDMPQQNLVAENKTNNSTNQNIMPLPLRLDWDEPAASSEQYSELLKHFKLVLVQLDLINLDNPRLILQRMNRFLKRIQLDRSEYNFLRGFLARVEKVITQNTK